MSYKVTLLPAIRCWYCNADQVYKVVGKPEMACGCCHRSLCTWCEQCSKPFRDGERWAIIGDVVITDLKLNTKVVKERLVCKECSMSHSKAFDAKPSDEPKQDVPRGFMMCSQCADVQWYEGSALPGAFLCEACLKKDADRRMAMREVKPDLATFETMGRKIAADVEKAVLDAIAEAPARPAAEVPQPVMWLKCLLCPYLKKWDGVMSADNFVCDACKAEMACGTEPDIQHIFHKSYAWVSCTKCKVGTGVPDPVDALTWLCDECRAEISVVSVPFEPTKDPISFQALTPGMAGEDVDTSAEPTSETWRDRPPLL